MNPVWAAVITAAAAGIAIAALLMVRRRAPEGSYFADGDRAAGFFGVLATGFSVLLGLIVFLAFSSFDESRAGAEAEALLVRQQFETAQFLPARRPRTARRRAGLLRTIGRSRGMAGFGVGEARQTWRTPGRWRSSGP